MPCIFTTSLVGLLVEACFKKEKDKDVNVFKGLAYEKKQDRETGKKSGEAEVLFIMKL